MCKLPPSHSFLTMCGHQAIWCILAVRRFYFFPIPTGQRRESNYRSHSLRSFDLRSRETVGCQSLTKQCKSIVKANYFQASFSYLLVIKHMSHSVDPYKRSWSWLENMKTWQNFSSSPIIAIHQNFKKNKWFKISKNGLFWS